MERAWTQDPHPAHVHGHIDRHLRTSREAIHRSLDTPHYASDKEILNPDTELRLGKFQGDAELLGFILHEELGSGGATRSAYRGIVFAHMILDELGCENSVTMLDEYWETSLGLPCTFIEEKIYTDACSYIYEHQDINDFLAYFMDELITEHGYEHMVEIGAALVLRQAEIDSAIDELAPMFEKQLNSLPELDKG